MLEEQQRQLFLDTAQHKEQVTAQHKEQVEGKFVRN
jgi:hypothetical protein